MADDSHYKHEEHQAGRSFSAGLLLWPLIVAQQQFKATCFRPSPDVVDPEQVGGVLVGFEVTCKPVGYIELVVESGIRIRVSKDPTPGDC